MKSFVYLALALGLCSCASLVELHQNLESHAERISTYQQSLVSHPTCENKLMKSRIVNGTDVNDANPLSKRAVLITAERNNRKSSCTAVPLTESILMTAAHCVSDAEPSKVQAMFVTDMNCQSGADRRMTVTATRIVIHPEYDKTPQSKKDLALIKLSSNIPTDYKTADLYDGQSALSNDEVVMLGYGITDEQKQDSLVLRTTTKSYKSDSFVKESLIGFNQTNKSGGFCRGDSGAPIYVTSGGNLKVIGVNSFNVGKEKNKECHTASFGMYAPYFKSWILSQSVAL